MEGITVDDKLSVKKKDINPTAERPV